MSVNASTVTKTSSITKAGAEVAVVANQYYGSVTVLPLSAIVHAHVEIVGCG